MKKYISTTIFCTVLITATHAQPTDYYNSRAHQNAEYKTQSQATQRAFSVPDKPYSIPVYKSSTSSTSSNTNSSGSSSSNGGKINNNGGYINIGGGDKVLRQQEAGSQNQARIDEFSKKEARFEELSKGIPHTPANFNRLVSLAEQAGIDNYTATRMLGYINVTEKRTIRSDESGYTYTGDARNGQPYGQGTYTFDNGDVISGEMVDGYPNGKGTIKWGNGATYEGTLLKGNASGYGTITYPKGTKYTGQLVDGRYEGTGTLYFSNGDTYTGQFKKSDFDGPGVYKMKSATFAGDFKNDKPVYGTLTYSQGSEFTGFLYDNFYPKVGEYHESKLTYSGWFNDKGKREGYGLFSYSEGDLLEGEIKDGESVGLGRYTGTNKQTVAGKFNYKGYSIYGVISHEGKWYAGYMKDGKMGFLPNENNAEGLAIYKEVEAYLETERKRYNAVMSEQAIVENKSVVNFSTKTSSAISSANSKESKIGSEKSKVDNKTEKNPIASTEKSPKYLFTDWNSAKKYEWLWLETAKEDSNIYRIVTNNKLEYVQYKNKYMWTLADLKLKDVSNWRYSANTTITQIDQQYTSTGLLMQADYNSSTHKGTKIIFMVTPSDQTYWFGYHDENTGEWKTLNKYEGKTYNIFNKIINKLTDTKGAVNELSVYKNGNEIVLGINNQAVEFITINETNSVLNNVFGIGIVTYQKGKGSVDKISFSVYP